LTSTSLDSTDNKHGVQRQVRRCRRRRNFIYYIEYFRKAAGILLFGVWCKNIRYNIPIITLVGVCPDGLSHPEALWCFKGKKSNTFHFSTEFVIFHKRESHNIKNEFDSVNNVCVLPLHLSLLDIYYQIIILVGVCPDGLSHPEKLGHPRASPRLTFLFSGRQTIRSHSNKGDNCIRSDSTKPTNHTVAKSRLAKLT
jgi:hypothetical protein